MSKITRVFTLDEVVYSYILMMHINVIPARRLSDKTSDREVSF